MKQLALIAALAVFASSAMATGNVQPPAAGTAGSTAVAAQQQQQQTNASSVSSAANQGNSQNITFTSPPSTTATVNQTVSGTTTQNVNQTGSLTSNNTNTSVSTVNGDTTNRQIVSGGTDSTIRQEFGSQTIRNTPSVNGPPLVSSNDTCMGSASGSVNAPGFGLSLGKTYTDTNCVMLKNSREMWNMGMKAAAMALMCTDGSNRDALEMTGYECPQTTREKQKQAQAASIPASEPTDPIVRRRMGLPALK